MFFFFFLVFHMSRFVNNKDLAGAWFMVSSKWMLRVDRSLPFGEDRLKLLFSF